MIRIFLIILVAAVLLSVLLGYVTFRMGFYYDNKERDMYRLDEGEYAPTNGTMIARVHELAELPYEEVSITSNDGLKLYGKYYAGAPGAPIALMVHGYHAIAERDFCAYHKMMREKNYNILLIDQRSHGKSEGHAVTFGVLEREDVLEWCRYLMLRFGQDTRILLMGVSMGAATVMMSTALPLPSNVKGIVADCGYSSPEKIIKLVIPSMVPFPTPIVYPFVKLGAVIFGHFSVTGASAESAMKQCQLPILFIHGEADTFVPFYMVHEVYDACVSGHKALYPVPGVVHARASLADYEGCLARVNELCEEIGL